MGNLRTFRLVIIIIMAQVEYDNVEHLIQKRTEVPQLRSLTQLLRYFPIFSTLFPILLSF